jgi:toxin ParE1/3/4
MSQYRISDAARADLEEIWFYIAGDRAEAADRVTRGIINRFPALADFPGMGRSREELAPGLRSFPVGNYVIFYRPIEDGIAVVRVLHGARDIDAIFHTEQ